jgi:hypothetical protein
VDQLFQIVGAILILAAFVASQQNRLRVDSVRYLALNTAGAAILAVVAAVNRDLGFLLLEGVWTVVSAVGLRKAVQADRTAKRPEPKG